MNYFLKINLIKNKMKRNEKINNNTKIAEIILWIHSLY